MSGFFEPADRMKLIDASGIRKVFDLAAKMTNPINLSIGQPDFDVPDNIRQAGIDAINSGMNKYTQTQGDSELRNTVSDTLKQELGWGEQHPCLITSGVSGALVLAFLTQINPGDEVIILDPYFVMYSHLVNLCGGVPIRISTYPDFRPDAQKIAEAVTDRTKILILNSPANPTGVVYSRQEMSDIAEVATKHNLLVISDEIYNAFCYDDPFVSFGEFYENTLLMRGFSKAYAMTGWRLGYCAGPKSVIESMTMLQQYSFVCAPSMAQIAGITAMGTDVSEYVAAYRNKRNMVADALCDKFGLVKPGGAFYAFVPAPKGMSATEFVTKAIDKNVLIIPGNVFSAEDSHFRISYATTDENLARGLDILRSIQQPHAIT